MMRLAVWNAIFLLICISRQGISDEDALVRILYTAIFLAKKYTRFY